MIIDLNKTDNRSFKLGEIYLMKFDGRGNEQSGLRPGLVFQNNTGNLHSPNIIALPLTSVLKKTRQKTHVLLRSQDTGLDKDSIILCENPERMSKERVGKYITTLTPEQLEKVAIASLLATSIIQYLSMSALMRVKRMATELNSL